MPSKTTTGRKPPSIEREIANLADAIASGALRTSPAIAQRLQAAEAEFGRLQGQRAVKHIAQVPAVRNVRGWFLERAANIQQVLMQDPERGARGAARHPWRAH